MGGRRFVWDIEQVEDSRLKILENVCGWWGDVVKVHSIYRLLLGGYWYKDGCLLLGIVRMLCRLMLGIVLL